MTEATSLSPAASQRQEAILAGAFGAFSTYGFRKTSMDDIARAAGMSRSALYLSYRNKEEILRALAAGALSEAMRGVEDVLGADEGTLEEVLLAAFVAKDGRYMEAVLSTPHAAEIVEDGLASTRDIIADAEANMRRLLAEWLSRRGVPPDVGSPDEVAASIVSALSGLKSTSPDYPTYRQGERQLARIFARALT